MKFAARGTRDLDGGEEAVADAAVAAALRAQAARVHLKSVLAALVLTGLALLLPS